MLVIHYVEILSGTSDKNVIIVIVTEPMLENDAPNYIHDYNTHHIYKLIKAITTDDEDDVDEIVEDYLEDLPGMTIYTSQFSNNLTSYNSAFPVNTIVLKTETRISWNDIEDYYNDDDLPSNTSFSDIFHEL